MKKVILLLVLLFTAERAAAKHLFIPVSGVAPGVNDTLFRTDVRLFNPSFVDEISISVHFLPQGWDGSNISGRLVTLKPREMVVLNNIVQDFLQWPAPAVGAIWLDSNTDRSYWFVAESRTYTNSPRPEAPGTYGQYVPALDVEKDAHKQAVVLHVSHSGDAAGSRTNAGVMNPHLERTFVTASLFRADGTLIADSQSFEVPPRSMIQRSVPSLFGDGVEVEDGYIEFNSLLDVFTWGSVVDNSSNDGMFVIGAEDKATIGPLP